MEDAPDHRLRRLQDIYDRYRLRLVIVSLADPGPFYVIMAIIVDATGAGPALTVGLKAGFDLCEAIVGAVEEAQQPRAWLRDRLVLGASAGIERRSATRVTTLIDRALYWARAGRASYLTSLFDNSSIVRYEHLSGRKSNRARSWHDVYAGLLSYARQSGLTYYVVDVTNPAVKECGLYVVKVVVPEAHPLYLDEGYPYLRSERLDAALKHNSFRWGDVQSIDKGQKLIPHPFI
jgi:ribosomal protein S12 methylthiotransferase accessory factor